MGIINRDGEIRRRRFADVELEYVLVFYYIGGDFLGIFRFVDL